MLPDVSLYETGATVYEPFLGLCTIVSSTQETMLGVEQMFYQLRPPQGTSVVKVPASQMTSRGIRPLMSEAELEGVLVFELPNPEEKEETYGQRLRRWTERLRSGDHFGATKVLREIRVLVSRGVRLSPKENELQETLNRTVRQEIAAVLGISPGKASVRLSQAVAMEKGKK